MPYPGDLPDPGIEPLSLGSPALAGGFFIITATWEARMWLPCGLNSGNGFWILAHSEVYAAT